MANPTGRGGFRDHPENICQNPGGRPKRKPISDALREVLEAPAHEGVALTNAQMVARQMVSLAIGGDVQAAKLILGYTEGLPTQRVEFDLEREAERYARELGVDASILIAEVEAIAARAMAEDDA